MRYDIRNMGRKCANERTIDMALPVLAVECEATPPRQDYLDAYEKAVLKFISIGLSSGGIARALNATESLVEEILDHLLREGFVSKESGRPWTLTENGQKYLKGSLEERASDHSQYGYMFVNAIKKEVFPYFYQGDVQQIPLYNKGSGELPLKLNLKDGEDATFIECQIKRGRLRDAYKRFYQNTKIAQKYEDDEISYEQAVDLFEDEDSFDEEDNDTLVQQEESAEKGKLSGSMFIRALDRPPKFMYLTIHIILDPQYPGGYRVESPFNMNGIDDSYYLRQIQWLEATGMAYIEGEKLSEFLTREIRKICPSYQSCDMDFSVFILQKMPGLREQKEKFSAVYENMSRVYPLIKRQKSLIEKENIVSNISRYVVEALFNEFFRKFSKDDLTDLGGKAEQEIRYYHVAAFKRNVFKETRIDPDSFFWKENYLRTVIGRLSTTHGNSILEKFMNVSVLAYYYGNGAARKFLQADNAQKMYDLSDKLNQIRRKVSHDTDDHFTSQDYKFYIDNVFELINGLLEAHRED